MDVFHEGKGAITHADLTLHDCAMTPNTATWPFLSNMSKADQLACEGQPKKCMLVPYEDGCGQSDEKKKELKAAGQEHKIKTPHHLLPDHCVKGVPAKPGKEAYAHGKAPCVCAEGPSWNSVGPNNQPLKHNRYHRRFDVAEAKATLAGIGADPAAPMKKGDIQAASTWKYKDAKQAAIDSCVAEDKCDEACIAVQLKSYYEKRCGMKANDDLDCTIARGEIRQAAADQMVKEMGKKATKVK
jgi:hypothetical protein